MLVKEAFHVDVGVSERWSVWCKVNMDVCSQPRCHCYLVIYFGHPLNLLYPTEVSGNNQESNSTEKKEST